MESVTDTQVVVHAFVCYDDQLCAQIVPPFKATQETIRSRYRGQPLPHTAERVDREELDGEGRWTRIASGWGALDGE